MSIRNKTLAVVGALMVSASAATATPLTTFAGTYWDAPANSFADINAAIGYATTNAASATFTGTDIDYGDSSTGWAIGSLADFLNADAGSIAGTDDGSIQESVFRFTGMVDLSNGDMINVTSDDGFRLEIAGSTFSEFLGLRGPGNSTAQTWTGASGRYAATLWYFEGNVSQAQLQSNLGDFLAPVPLPAGALLLFAGLGSLIVVRRRQSA